MVEGRSRWTPGERQVIEGTVDQLKDFFGWCATEPRLYG